MVSKLPVLESAVCALASTFLLYGIGVFRSWGQVFGALLAYVVVGGIIVAIASRPMKQS